MIKTVNEAIAVCVDIIAAVASAGPLGMPSGHAYASVMDRVDLKLYDGLVAHMIEKNWLVLRGNVLRLTEDGRKEFESAVKG